MSDVERAGVARSRGRPLKVGVFLNDDDRIARWRDLVGLARLAEESGFDSLWVGDHLLFRSLDERHGQIEAWSSLAALAAVTERVELGPLVACTAFRNPALLAKTAASVDDISGGRLVLGLGAGWNEVEFEAFGYPLDHRVARFAEALRIIRALLRDGALDFSGSYYQVRDCELRPRPSAVRPVPILVGSTSERLLRAALPSMDGWNAWYTATSNRPDEARALNDRIDGLCDAAGRDRGAVARTLAVLVRSTMGGAAADPPGDSPTPQGTAALSGSPEEIAAGLLDFASAGIEHVQLVLNPISAPAIAALQPVLELLDRAPGVDRPRGEP